MVEKVVDYKVKYKGETDIDIINGKVYQCVMECYEDGELFTIGVVDESGEYYQYDPGDFDIVTE